VRGRSSHPPKAAAGTSLRPPSGPGWRRSERRSRPALTRSAIRCSRSRGPAATTSRTTRWAARATQNLSRFDLDSRMQGSVTRLLVNGAPASFGYAVDRGLGADRGRRLRRRRAAGSPGWYPVNDNPRDKPTFDFRITVPDGLTVMANAVLVSQTHAGGKATWVWHEGDPTAAYLATTTLGRFDLTIHSRRRRSRTSRRCRTRRRWCTSSRTCGSATR
jgi:hypothetical protein